MNYVHFINAFGTDMWVTEDRVDEYLAAGHKLAADSEAEKPTEKPKKKATTAKKTKK